MTLETVTELGVRVIFIFLALTSPKLLHIFPLSPHPLPCAKIMCGGSSQLLQNRSISPCFSTSFPSFCHPSRRQSLPGSW